MNYKAMIVAVVLALSLVAAACGDDSTDEETEAETTTTAGEETTTVAEDTTTMAEDTTTMAEDTTTMAEDTTTMAGDDADADGGTIVDVAAEAGTFATLLAAAQAAGLDETLSGPGPFTVFAPTDEAFEAALTELGLTADELLADTETLTSILTYHVIEGEVLSTDLSDGMTATTVNGADVTFSVNGGVMVNEANVVTPDVPASNGVIHIIDAVLLPPS